MKEGWKRMSVANFLMMDGGMRSGMTSAPKNLRAFPMPVSQMPAAAGEGSVLPSPTPPWDMRFTEEEDMFRRRE